MFFKDKNWNGFDLVKIPARGEKKTQNAYFYAGSRGAPLLVSLHTWAGSYAQQDPLARLAKDENWNYIHPDFNGPNNSPDACMSGAAIQSIDAAVSFALENSSPDKNKIAIAGLSGGGSAVLCAFLKSSYKLKYCMAWAPVTCLPMWHNQSKHAKNEYWRDIEKSTSSKGGLNEEEAKKRSPLHMTPKSKDLCYLDIYAGLNDGYTGTVSVLHSILFYNKIMGCFNSAGDAVNERETTNLLSRNINPETNEYLWGGGGDKRKLFYKKENSHAGLFIFEGAHEILPHFAFSRIKKQIGA
ncbi:MAG: prolyl oligopeptidase family serine peptidase [Spirochaetaceae bacterium]|jgi:esterase/lipase|nr:prolyl oligopeptidase family serine peptidase [Spirochaetaceae bacterium]